MVHQQREQRGALRGGQLDVLLVLARWDLLYLPYGCSPES